MHKPPPIVADLGRPETPEETAARKAENSRKHRAAQTVRNLLWALAATLAVVLFLVLVVVRPDLAPPAPIDYDTVAGQVQAELNTPISAPVLPPQWSANQAEVRKQGEISVWYVGFITPDEQFIALNQGIDANPTWVDNVLNRATPTGKLMIDNVEWTVYDHRKAKDPGNLAYALVTVVDKSTYVLYGTASDVEFETLATAMEVG